MVPVRLFARCGNSTCLVPQLFRRDVHVFNAGWNDVFVERQCCRVLHVSFATIANWSQTIAITTKLTIELCEYCNLSSFVVYLSIPNSE